jgi:hypothetical protein
MLRSLASAPLMLNFDYHHEAIFVPIVDRADR